MKLEGHCIDQNYLIKVNNTQLSFLIIKKCNLRLCQDDSLSLESGNERERECGHLFVLKSVQMLLAKRWAKINVDVNVQYGVISFFNFLWLGMHLLWLFLCINKYIQQNMKSKKSEFASAIFLFKISLLL